MPKAKPVSKYHTLPSRPIAVYPKNDEQRAGIAAIAECMGGQSLSAFLLQAAQFYISKNAKNYPEFETKKAAILKELHQQSK